MNTGRILSIILLLAVSLSSGCTLARGTVIKAVSSRGTSLDASSGTAAVLYASGDVITYNGESAAKRTLSQATMSAMGEITFIRILSSDMTAFITRANGIFILPSSSSLIVPVSELIHLSVSEKALARERIRDLFYCEKNRSLYVLYDTPETDAVTICTFGEDRAVSFSHLNATNSPLKTNYVHQITADAMDNIWFRYSPDESRGASRLSPQGKWMHFDRNNSDIGSSSLTMICPEISGSGLDGRNVWFASCDGLARLDYTDSGEEWKYYGQKQTTVNLLTRVMGIESWFTEAILNIVEIIPAKGRIVIANAKAVYFFDGNEINRIIPESAGGIDQNIIRSVVYREGYCFVTLTSLEQNDGLIRIITVFDEKNKEWKKLSFWQYAQEFPNEIILSPLSSGRDLMILRYGSRGGVVLEYIHETGTLKTFSPSAGTDGQK